MSEKTTSILPVGFSVLSRETHQNFQIIFENLAKATVDEYGVKGIMVKLANDGSANAKQWVIDRLNINTESNYTGWKEVSVDGLGDLFSLIRDRAIAVANADLDTMENTFNICVRNNIYKVNFIVDFGLKCAALGDIKRALQCLLVAVKFGNRFAVVATEYVLTEAITRSIISQQECEQYFYKIYHMCVENNWIEYAWILRILDLCDFANFIKTLG